LLCIVIIKILDFKKGAGKKFPPAPPPKPKGAEVEAELFRRRQKELMGKLVTEFQVCQIFKKLFLL
jgi:hypothetical protein